MIKMVLDVNKSTFHGNPQVSCWTCHRGRTSPPGFPNLPLPVPTPRPSPAAGAPGATPQASPGPTQALPSVDDIFNKYFAAIGGQQAIDKLKSRVAKIEDDLRRSNRAEEARKVKEKFEKWLDEVQR